MDVTFATTDELSRREFEINQRLHELKNYGGIAAHDEYAALMVERGDIRRERDRREAKRWKGPVVPY
jgi:hypothetical protein